MPHQALIQPFNESNSQVLRPFVKIMQSFLLMQNTWKRNWIGGGEIFGSPFIQKNAHFGL